MSHTLHHWLSLDFHILLNFNQLQNLIFFLLDVWDVMLESKVSDIGTLKKWILYVSLPLNEQK